MVPVLSEEHGLWGQWAELESLPRTKPNNALQLTAYSLRCAAASGSN
jgi:hypothetical protein